MMYIGPLTSDAAKAYRAAANAVDRHVWPWWAVGYRPTRRKPWRGMTRRHDIAATIAPAVEKCVRQSVAASLATLDDPAWADAIQTAIDLVSIGEEWAPVAKPATPKPLPLLPFSGEDATCVKCGRSNPDTTFMRQGYLVRVCRCGHGWQERTADAEALEESASDDTPESAVDEPEAAPDDH